MPETDSDKLIFYSDRRPALENGDYTLTIKQTLTGVPGAPVFSRQQEVSVLGPRFTLDPQDIHSFFPPEGSLGQYSNVLPHVMLNRCSLPWERSAKKTATPPPPWLALLVLDESELNQNGATPDPAKAAVFSSTLEAMGYPQGGPNLPWTVSLPEGCTGWMPTGLASEYGDLASGKKGTPVTLLRVPWALSEVLLPAAADLPYTVHARRATAAQATRGPAAGNKTAVVPPATADHPDTDLVRQSGADEPFAAVLATRLPAAGNKATVYLVSLEGHYEAPPTTPPTARVFFVLATWHFACLSATHDFAGLLKNADCGPFCLPSAGLNTQTARDQIDSGFVGLPHLMRQGNRSASWYRGPLLPGAPVDTVALPGGGAIAHADELVRYDRHSGMFDVTYAAAWELGRLLMLSDRRASLDLSHWKEAHSQSLKDAANALEHLPAKEFPPNLAPLELPESVTHWFNDVQMLKGIPANYLIPDDRYLPTESIRFFHLDPLWLDCCLDGAFSVGFVRGVSPPAPVVQTKRTVTGFLLRSAVVSGWPQLQIEATDDVIIGDAEISGDAKPKSTLKILRQERLSKNILLCLFEGTVATLDIHLPPERLHFGFKEGEKDGRDVNDFTKPLRDPGTGVEIAKGAEPVPLKDCWVAAGGKNRVVSLANLAGKMASGLKKKSDPLNPAEFALEMIVGVERVRFAVGGS